MKTLAVHLHLYYLEQLPDILKYLESLEAVDYDLFITMIQKNESAEKQIMQAHPTAQIKIVSNRGYDIGSFIDFLSSVDLNNYEYILKIHTKGEKSPNHTLLNKRWLNNKLWKEILFQCLLKSKTRLLSNLKILEKNKKIGMISSVYCTTSEPRTYQALLPEINRVLQKIGFHSVQHLTFVAGTMFLTRAFLLKPLCSYSLADFKPTDAQLKEGTLAHTMERVFGALVEQQGYKVYGINHDQYALAFFLFRLKHFFYQKKQTASGHLIIKICRIPIWHQKRGV